VSDKVAATATAEVGTTFDIRLEGSPTTGYRWEARSVPALVELVDHRLEPDLKRAGGRATYRFTFQAKRPGSARLEFVYKRPWEDEARERREFIVLVTS
jgi:predicted secreted protein